MLDLVVESWGTGASALMGLGGGSFAPAVEYATHTIANSLAIGDLDGDGALDLVVVSRGSDDVLVLRNQLLE